MNNNDTVLTFSRIIMPVYLHLEHVCARMLLRWYGTETFPNVADAPILFTEDKVLGDDKSFDKRGDLPLGCCEHSRFGGEHAALAVAKQLGISENPELKAILEAFGEDCTRSETGLPKLFSTLRKISKDILQVLDWTDLALDAVIFRQIYSPAAVPGEMSLEQIFPKIVKKLKLKDAKILDKVTKQVMTSQRRSMDPLELSYLVAALFRRPGIDGNPATTPEKILVWVETIISALVYRQIEFESQVTALSNIKPVWIQSSTTGKIKSLKLFVVRSENDQIANAAWFHRADLVIVRKADGHTQIFHNWKTLGLTLANVGKMIEWYELPDNGRNVQFKSLGSFDADRGITWWHISKEGDLHNLAPHVATSIGLQGLIEIMQYAFHWQGMKLWCSLRHIWMNDGSSGAAKKRESASAAGENSLKEALKNALVVKKVAATKLASTKKKAVKRTKANSALVNN